ncbi:MAG TPA: prolipoprotein diacylglyceryl transferase family protein [Candidatus Kryptonia bacterium]|nr:prolipoprotein diacylglyceryl transferase family protein [Candidatus Kryptonia bacterium]
MLPSIFGLNTYFLFWGVAAVFGVSVGVTRATTAGFPRGRSFTALLAFTLAILLGSKLLFIVEHTLFPWDDPAPQGQESVAELLWHGFRIPGGILLLAPAFPLVCRRLRLPTLRFADAVIPAAAVAVVCIRIGCFCNGCCFGRLTDLPVGVTFPPGSRAYEWQLLQGLIGGPAPRSLPMHPLQLYFALLGVLLYTITSRMNERPHVDGQVLSIFYLVFFSGTFLLELMRPSPLHLNLILTATVVAVAVALTRRLRLVTAPAVRVAS